MNQKACECILICLAQKTNLANSTVATTQRPAISGNHGVLRQYNSIIKQDFTRSIYNIPYTLLFGSGVDGEANTTKSQQLEI
jgi:hypothetical protein